MEGTGLHDEALFRYLVERLETEAWLGLGKILNPATGKPERQLEFAKLAIDVLGMIERKTEGHRSDDETKLVRNALTTLRLNYVDEVSKPAPVEPSGTAGGADSEAATGAASVATEAGGEEPTPPSSEKAGP